MRIIKNSPTPAKRYVRSLSLVMIFIPPSLCCRHLSSAGANPRFCIKSWYIPDIETTWNKIAPWAIQLSNRHIEKNLIFFYSPGNVLYLFLTIFITHFFDDSYKSNRPRPLKGVLRLREYRIIYISNHAHPLPVSVSSLPTDDVQPVITCQSRQNRSDDVQFRNKKYNVIIVHMGSEISSQWISVITNIYAKEDIKTIIYSVGLTVNMIHRLSLTTDLFIHE